MRRGVIPRKQVGRETPFQERRRADSVLLAWEELEAVLWIDVIEGRVDMRSSDDHETAVKDTNGGGVPASGQEVDVGGVLEERAALAGWRCAGLKDT